MITCARGIKKQKSVNFIVHECKFFLDPSRIEYVGETDSLLAHLGRSKNDPGLEMFLVLYDEKIYPVHKRTKGGSEIVCYYFFKFQRLVL